MKLNYFVSFFCFLIISCDLPNEADADCAGVNNGTALIDDCGVCSGGTTGVLSNSNKDCNGECFGVAYVDGWDVCDENTENDGLTCQIECTEQESSEYDCYDGSQYCWNYDEDLYCGCELLPPVCSDCPGDDSGDSWLDCLCEYADFDGVSDDPNSTSSMPYEIGDQLTNADINVVFSTCYPDNCDDSFSLSDFSGRKFLLIYEEDW